MPRVNKNDCFAYNNKEGDCYALKELVCKKEICSFFKTKKELNDSRQRSLERRLRIGGTDLLSEKEKEFLKLQKQIF